MSQLSELRAASDVVAPMRGWELIVVWALLLFLSLCMLVGAYVIGREIVTASWHFWAPASASVPAAAERDIRTQGEDWASWAPKRGAAPSVHYVNEHRVVVRVEQRIQGEWVLCTIAVDAAARHSSIAC